MEVAQGDAACLPGEVLWTLPEDGGGGTTVRLGSGTTMDGGAVKSTKAGLLRRRDNPKRFWVERRHQRYVPSLEDLVVGIVMEAHGENFAVDIGGPCLAQLPILDFTGATRRNRPMLRYGDVVYARVTLADRDIDPTISCVDASVGRSKGLGPLKGGLTLKCATGCARDLLAGAEGSGQEDSVLSLLGGHLHYECCLGVNGLVWVKGETHAETILVRNAIQNYETIERSAHSDGSASDAADAQITRKVRAMVAQLLKQHASDRDD